MTPTLTSLLLRLGGLRAHRTPPAAARIEERRRQKATRAPNTCCTCGLCDACWISRPYSSCWCCWSYSRSNARCHQMPLSLNTLLDAILLVTLATRPGVKQQLRPLAQQPWPPGRRLRLRSAAFPAAPCLAVCLGTDRVAWGPDVDGRGKRAVGLESCCGAPCPFAANGYRQKTDAGRRG